MSGRSIIGLGFPVALGLLTCFAPQRAAASGLDAPQVGSMEASPLGVNASAVHWNPGQLGYLQHGSTEFGASLIFGRIGHDRVRRGQYQYEDNLDFSEPIDPANIDPTKTGPAGTSSATVVGPLVDFFIAGPVIRDRLVLGGGVYIPYAAVLDFPKNASQRFALQSITLASVHSTFSAAVKLHERVSLGAGVSYVFSYLELSKVQDFGAVDLLGNALEGEPFNQANDFGADAPSTVRELDVMARPIEISRAVSHSASFNVGLAARPTDNLDLGFVYQHGSRLRFRGDFQLDMNDEFFTQDLASQGLQYPALVRGDAEIELRLPKRITLAAGYQINSRIRIDAWASYVTYREFDRIDIQLTSPDLAQPELGIGPSAPQPLVRNWVDTVHVEVAPRIQVTDKVGINTLVGYNSPASPDSTVDLASPDGHRLILGGGVNLGLTPRFSLLVDLETQFIIPRSVTTSDFDLGNGDYSLFLGQLGLHGRLKFGRAFSKRRSEPSGGDGEAPKASAEPPA